MQTQIQNKLSPRAWFTVLGIAIFSVLVMTTIVPVGYWTPASVTETATVIAVTEKGCVVEGSYGYPMTVADCSAKPGETIEVSYNMPAIVNSQYMQRVQARASYVVP